MKLNAMQRDALVASLLLVVVGGGILLYMAGASVDLPDIDVKDTATAIVGAVVGLLLMVVGGFIVYAGVKTGFRPSLLLTGALLLILPLPLIGVNLGVPAWLQPFVTLLQAIADGIQALIDLLRRIIK